MKDQRERERERERIGRETREERQRQRKIKSATEYTEGLSERDTELERDK